MPSRVSRVSRVPPGAHFGHFVYTVLVPLAVGLPLAPTIVVSQLILFILVVLTLAACSESDAITAGEASDEEVAAYATDAGWDETSAPPIVGAPAITAEPGTALNHAQQCQEHLGRIPSFSCADLVEIPVEVSEDGTCLNPGLLGSCIPGSMIGSSDGENFDGTTLPQVQWAFFCRSGDRFVQMIGHNTSTGATCFFELKDDYMPHGEQVGIDEFPLSNVVAGVVPDPEDPTYEEAWKAPEDVWLQTCNACHTPDPFIHTPYSRSARDPADPSRPILPEIASPTNLYFLVVPPFDGWTLRYVEFDEPNGCIACHRLGNFLRFTGETHVTYNDIMPPHAPGTMTDDYEELCVVWSRDLTTTTAAAGLR